MKSLPVASLDASVAARGFRRLPHRMAGRRTKSRTGSTPWRKKRQTGDPPYYLYAKWILIQRRGFTRLWNEREVPRGR